MKPHVSQSQRCPWKRALTAKLWDLGYQMYYNHCVSLRASSCHIGDVSYNLNIVIDRWLFWCPGSVGKVRWSVGRFTVWESNTNPPLTKKLKQPQTSWSTSLDFQKNGYINTNSWFFFSFKGYYSNKIGLFNSTMELFSCLVGWVFLALEKKSGSFSSP